MKKELIELGYIIDLNHNRWDAYCESKTFKGRGEDLEVVCEGIVLELAGGDEGAAKARLTTEYPHSTCGILVQSINAPSLSEMPDRFSQAQCNALESWILEQERNDQIAYAIDNAYDQRREF